MLVRSLLFWLVLSGAGLLCAQAPAGQNAPEMKTENGPATFQSKVNLVLVPVVVRDVQGHAVGTLKQENFHLFDKGKPQVISRFSIEKTGGANAEKADSGEAPANGPEVGGAKVTFIPQRYVAYVFDDLHLEFGDLARVQKAATNHLATALQPTDRAAILTTSGQGNLDFTDDRAKLQEAVMRLRSRPMFKQQANDCPYMTYYMADQIINKNDQQALQAGAADTIACAAVQDQQMAQQMVQNAAISMLPMGEQDARVTLDVLKNVVRRISVMPGQRTVIIASPGFLTLTPESFTDRTDILDRAARANVMISALDARGLYTDSEFDASQRGS